MKELNVRAADLRTKLGGLIREFRDLQSGFLARPGDAASEAAGEIDGVACALATIYDRLPHVFIAAYEGVG